MFWLIFSAICIGIAVECFRSTFKDERTWKDDLADQLDYEEHKKKGWLP